VAYIYVYVCVCVCVCVCGYLSSSAVKWARNLLDNQVIHLLLVLQPWQRLAITLKLMGANRLCSETNPGFCYQR
jgi:hypothetical protein